MPWTDGLDEATLGHAKLNGWLPEGNAEEVARAAVQAHLGAQKLLQAPAGEFIRVPKDPNDVEGWGRVHEALGAAKDPKEYVFDGVKFKDGTVLDDGLIEVLRGTAEKLHLSPVAAQALAADIVRWADEGEAAAATERSTVRASEDIKLRQAWSGNYDVFKANADRAAVLLGLTPEDIDAMAGTKLGYVGTYEKLRVLSDRVGESKFHTGQGGNSLLKPLSREEAIAAREAFMTDLELAKNFHTKENQEYLMHLNRIIVGLPA